MPQNKSSHQVFNKPVKNVINIGKLTLNSRVVWSIVIALVLGSGSLAYMATRPKTVTNDHSTTNIDNSSTEILINQPLSTPPGEKPSAADTKKAKAQAVKYQEATQQNPNDAIAWTNLGEALRRSGDVPGAQQAQEKALQLNPTMNEAQLGLALAKKEKEKAASIAKIRQIAEGGRNALAYIYLGYLLSELKDFSGAEDAFRKSIAIDPNNAAAHYDLGISLKMQGKLDDAIASLQTALRIDPNFAWGHTALGLVLAAQGKLDSANSSFQTALRIDPDLAPAHAGLGMVFMFQENLNSATASLQTALRIDPDLAVAHAVLGLVLSAQGKPDKAITSFQAALRIDPTVVEPFNSEIEKTYNNFGFKMLDQEKLDSAISFFQTALRMNPNLAESHMGLGVALLNQGKKSEGELQLKQAISLFQKQGEGNTEKIKAINELLQLIRD
jgi:superkiller protein 3